MTDFENLKSYREICGTRNALTPSELTLALPGLCYFVCFVLIVDRLLGCLRTIHELHEIHEITRRVFPDRFSISFKCLGQYYRRQMWFPRIKRRQHTRVFARAAFVLAALCVWSLPAHAQSFGRVSGVVKDQQGASVSGAKVSLIPSQQPAVQTTETDISGLFSFQHVAAGSYEIRIEHSGFTSHSLPVNVSSGQLAELSAVLEVAGIRDVVTVTAETGQAQDKHLVAQQVNVVNEQAIIQRTTGVLAQVADEEVGVSMQRTSPTIGAVLVRGLTEVGVYVDGVRYTNSTQRGGINTFFNLNEPTSLRSVEMLRGPNTAQYGSDSLGGNVQVISRTAQIGRTPPQWNGELNTLYNSADHAFGGNALIGYGTKKFGILTN